MLGAAPGFGRRMPSHTDGNSDHDTGNGAAPVTKLRSVIRPRGDRSTVIASPLQRLKNTATHGAMHRAVVERARQLASGPASAVGRDYPPVTP